MEGKKLCLVFVITVILVSVVRVGGSADGLSRAEFDVRQHLGTASRYGAGKAIIDDAHQTSTDPPVGCTPIHVNLLARHGTRAPTKKRLKQLEQFSTRLETLLKSAVHTTTEDALKPQQIPAWLWGWRSPWEGKHTGGELTHQGEKELYHLGTRIRERFPELFEEDYHPDVYLISATQVPRTSASAVAFGMGLFARKGQLGPGQHRAFAVISDSRANDIHLRFHDNCQTYKEFKKMHRPALVSIQEETYAEVSANLRERYQLDFTKDDVASLWFLCKQEATLLDKIDQACGLFNPIEVELLEWVDDLELHYLKGYGESINYRMGVPLLQDVVRSMDLAIMRREGPYVLGFVEKARLRFAHAETIIPFSCLLGLFIEVSDIAKIQSEQPLQPPPKPPQQRRWRASTAAPFAANNMLVLYMCPAQGRISGNNISQGIQNNSFFVQILHNEKPVSIPSCNGTAFCPFEVFKERVAGPHLQHTFESVCTIKRTSGSCSLTCRLSRFLRQLFLRKGMEFRSCEDKAEL